MQFGRLDISDLCTSFCGGQRGEGISGTIVCMKQYACTACSLYHPLTSWPHTHTHTHTHTVYGALLGTQKGRSVEVCNSFELVVSSVEGHVVLDKEYFTAKEEQCTSGSD